ncbi:MAG: SpoIIE family protein phosphatase [Candidatus Solibacter sp.]|nr:SpoIIE family protein phosphatase [Candidatus Solibacter sp.]
MKCRRAKRAATITASSTFPAKASQPAEALVQAIVDDVNEFSGAARSDDITVALRGL